MSQVENKKFNEVCYNQKLMRYFVEKKVGKKLVYEKVITPSG